MVYISQKIARFALAFSFLFTLVTAQNEIIAKWTFDEGEGDTAYDISENENHFNLLNGVSWVDGLNGKALEFDGIDDKALCVDKPCQTGMNALTIESVIWLDSQPSGNQWGPIIGKWGPGSSEDDSWALDIDRNTPYGGHGVAVSSSTQHIYGDTPVPIQKWTHLVFTWDGTKMVLYIDGEKVDTNLVSNAGLIRDSDTEIRLGHNVDPHYFDGKIDQITLYNYALTAGEVKANYNLLFGITNRIIAHWTFDEGSGDSAYDLSGNGNHFKLLNGVSWVDSKNGKALQFDGIDDKGLCIDKPDQTGMTALTIESVIWVEHHTATKWGPVIGKWGPGSTEDDAWALDVDRYSPYGGHGVVVGSSTKHINGTTPVPIQKWIHFVFTWNGSKMAIYINGKRTDSLTVSSISAIQDSDTEIRLGHNVDPHFFNGMIDQITLYDYALHPDTIIAHFEDLVGPSHEINIGMKKHYAKPGDELWVPVFIANYEDTISISSIQFSINIDTSVITFLDVSSDSGIASNWQLYHNPLGDSIAFSMGGVGQTIEYGEGELIRCKFKVKPSIPNGSFSDLVPSDVLIDEGNNVHPTTTLGKIIVDDINVMYGDVTGNNEVTAYDAAGIVKYVMGVLTLPDPNYPNFTTIVADVSGDGAITSYDAALVFMYSIGLLQKFPVESIKNSREYLVTEGFPNAAFKLVKSPLSTANTVYYDLLGSGIYGAVSSDIKIKYDPAKINIEQGGSITTAEYLNLESSVDKVNKTIQLSITTADDFDEKGIIKLATIEAPVPDTNSLEGALYFLSGLINEEVVEDLDPSNPTDISVAPNLTPNNAIVINKLGLVIHNGERLPVSIQVYDMRGRRLYTKLFDASDQLIKISTNTFAQGLYIYKIKMGLNTTTKPFLIRK